MSPEEVHQRLLHPAGLDGIIAVIAVSPSQSRIACRTWREAYALLTYCTPEVQRRLSLRIRPAVLDGVPLTRTQMARLAQNEAEPNHHLLRGSPPPPASPRSASVNPA